MFSLLQVLKTETMKSVTLVFETLHTSHKNFINKISLYSKKKFFYHNCAMINQLLCFQLKKNGRLLLWCRCVRAFEQKIIFNFSYIKQNFRIRREAKNQLLIQL